MLTEDKKAKIIDGVAKTRGFAVIRDSVLPLITNEKTCSVGYLKAITEEIFFRGVFDNAGEFNEDKKWGCWEGGDNPDCCGNKMIRDEIAGKKRRGAQRRAANLIVALIIRLRQ